MKIILFLTTISFFTQAYTLGIYTDEPGGAKAQEVIQELQNTYPFNVLDIEYQVIPQSTADLDCGFDPDIDRLPICDSRKQRRHARRNDIDQALVIMDSERYGGSGGGIPVMTTNSPPSTMVHEYLHTLGLCDEYQYSNADEADRYCPGMADRANSTIIAPEGSYSSDNQARSRHYRDIQWYADIASNTPITSGGGSSRSLGTGRVGDVVAPVNRTTEPSTLSSPIGLYRGTGCDNASRNYYLWHPGQERNIMERLSAGLGRANELIVRRTLLERGAQYKPEFDPDASPQLSRNLEVSEETQNKVMDSFDLIRKFKSQFSGGATKN